MRSGVGDLGAFCLLALAGCADLWTPKVGFLEAFQVSGPETGEVGKPFVVRGEAHKVGFHKRTYVVVSPAGTESLRIRIGLIYEFSSNPLDGPKIETQLATMSVEAPFIPAVPGTYTYNRGTGQTIAK